MKFLLICITAILIGIVIAQHPDNWTPSTNEPTNIPVLDCSARDASTSALASCTSHWDSAATDYPSDCRDLLFAQGLFSTCTIASPTPTKQPRYALMDGTTMATFTTTRHITELAPMPTVATDTSTRRTTELAPMDGTTTATLTSTRRIIRRINELAPMPSNVKGADTYPAPVENGLLGPPDPVFKLGYPCPDCPGKSLSTTSSKYRNAK